MLLDQIKTDSLAARKSGDAVEKSLLVTLYAEAAKVGKDAANRPSTDEEVVATVRKFMKNTEQTLADLRARNRGVSVQERELEILARYLPRQMSREEIEAAVETIAAGLDDVSPKAMGQVMGALKAAHGGAYDGKLAAEVVKARLAAG